MQWYFSSSAVTKFRFFKGKMHKIDHNTVADWSWNLLQTLPTPCAQVKMYLIWNSSRHCWQKHLPKKDICTYSDRKILILVNKEMDNEIGLLIYASTHAWQGLGHKSIPNPPKFCTLVLFYVFDAQGFIVRKLWIYLSKLLSIKFRKYFDIVIAINHCSPDLEEQKVEFKF